MACWRGESITGRYLVYRVAYINVTERTEEIAHAHARKEGSSRAESISRYTHTTYSSAVVHAGNLSVLPSRRTLCHYGIYGELREFTHLRKKRKNIYNVIYIYPRKYYRGILRAVVLLSPYSSLSFSLFVLL